VNLRTTAMKNESRQRGLGYLRKESWARGSRSAWCSNPKKARARGELQRGLFGGRRCGGKGGRQARRTFGTQRRNRGGCRNGNCHDYETRCTCFDCAAEEKM